MPATRIPRRFGGEWGIATVADSTAINTTATYVAPTGFVLVGGSLVAGDSFLIRAVGTCTATVAGTSTFVPRLGPAGTTADTSLGSFTATSAASGTNIGFVAEFYVVIRAVGAAGSVATNYRLTNQGVTGISTTTNLVTGIPVVTTINTTGNLILGLSYSSSLITTTTTFRQVTVSRA